MKKLLTLLVALSLALCALVGCNNIEKPDGAEPTDDVQVHVQPSDAATAVPTEVPTAEPLPYEIVELSYPSTKRDTLIPATVVIPEGEGSFPLVVLLHGHGGSRDEAAGFPAVADRLARLGIASIRMDFPGCGASSESFTLNTQTNMKNDVLDGINYALANYSFDPYSVALFGYSMGGRVAMELLYERSFDFAAAAFLAPAADTEDLKLLFGGSAAWDGLKATAEANSYADFTTIYGQQQQLGREWFADLEKYPNATLAELAGAGNTCPTLVIYAVDDAAVNPAVSRNVATLFGSELIETPEDGHSYGFYSDKVAVLEQVANGAAAFFADKLPRTPLSIEYSVNIDAGDHVIPATLCVPVVEQGVKVPAIVMLHGTASSRDEAGNGYRLAAPVLAETYGIASIRIDFIGNGASAGDYLNYNYSSAQADAVAAAKYLQGLESVNPEAIGVMGWSQGGTIAMLAASNNPELFKSVVTWAGAVDMMIEGYFSEADYEEAKKNGYFVMEFGWRSDLNVSLQWCEDVMNTDVLDAVKAYPSPILAIAGTADTTVDPVYAQKIYEHSKNEKSNYLYIEGMDHTFNVFTGDLSALWEAVKATGEFFADNLAK